MEGALIGFASVAGLVYCGGVVVMGRFAWPFGRIIRAWKKPPQYVESTRRTSYPVYGAIYVPSAGKIRHRCTNSNRVGKKSIWICQCSRAYRYRSIAHFIGRAERNRDYWWRVRPWHLVTYPKVVRLRRYGERVEIGGSA